MNLKNAMKRILYFGSYKSSYPRNRVIIDGLRQNGVEVIECNDRSRRPLSFLKLLRKYLRLDNDCDAVIIGFPGQEVMFLAKLLFFPKPIVFDVFTSHYMGYVFDRKYFSKNSWRAKYYKFLDRWSCKLADLVILDTQAHIDYFVKEFNLPTKKFRRIWLGANTRLHQPRKRANGGMFSVLFWGSFIPLQGVEHIVRAAKILEKEPVVFNLIGYGQTYEKNKKLAQDLGIKNINFLGRVSDEALIEHIRETDACLGTFSDSLKADITIQNKIFESLASQKPIITEESSAIRELLKDGQGAVFCKKADPNDLADKILMLKNNPTLRNKLAQDGYELFLEKLTPQKIGRELALVLNNVLR